MSSINASFQEGTWVNRGRNRRGSYSLLHTSLYHVSIVLSTSIIYAQKHIFKEFFKNRPKNKIVCLYQHLTYMPFKYFLLLYHLNAIIDRVLFTMYFHTNPAPFCMSQAIACNPCFHSPLCVALLTNINTTVYDASVFRASTFGRGKK